MRAFCRSTGLLVAVVACVLGTTALISAQAVQEQTATQDETVRIGPATTIEEGSETRTKWQYKIIKQGDTTDATELNKLGADGWELCQLQAILHAGRTMHTNLIFKRRAIPSLEDDRLRKTGARGYIRRQWHQLDEF